MLHILLLILKWIGIIIAAILGILVLLICIVLFVPVRYEVQGRSGGDLKSLKGKVKVTWLLHLFRADVYYKENVLKWRIRFAFLKRTSGVGFGNDERPEDKAKPDAEKEVSHKEVSHEEVSHEEGGNQDEEKQEEIIENDEKTAVDEKPEEAPRSKSVSEECEESEEDVEETSKTESTDDEKHQEDPKDIKSKGNRILQKIQAIYEKIKCTFKNFCDKIKELRDKKDNLAEFVTDEVHKKAFVRVKKELFWYLGKLKPKKMEAQVRYGFEDPYYTGKVLAYLSVLYPFMGEYTEITPDFERKILKGRLYVKGRIRVSHLVHLAWKLFWDKNIRKSYKDIKNFKL